jgi:hypothetical protein
VRCVLLTNGSLTLEGWSIENVVVLRWRFDYSAWDEEAFAFAEVGVCTTDKIVWATLAEFRFFRCELADKPASVWAKDLPQAYRSDFIELGKVLGQMARLTELAPAPRWANPFHRDQPATAPAAPAGDEVAVEAPVMAPESSSIGAGIESVAASSNSA